MRFDLLTSRPGPLFKRKQRVCAIAVAAAIWTGAVQACSGAEGMSAPQELILEEKHERHSEGRQGLAEYYREHAMLQQADDYTLELAGDEAQWNGPYMHPEAELMTDAAGEFLTIYPRSYLPASDQTVIGTLASEDLWKALKQIGITLMHPVAFEQAGVLNGRDLSPSVDGGFDRISLVPEPQLGSVQDVKNLAKTANSHGALVAGDIIPLHSGLGYDFRLAEMNYPGYPGIYDMIEIPEEHWGLLPGVEDEWGFAIIENDRAQPLIDLGLMPGRFDVLLGREESTNWSGWAATGEVMGVDGTTRRWIYAHLFKPEQPALNWMDPTYAARRLQAGDIARHVESYGTIINRLDAVPFIGLEPIRDTDGIDVFTTPLAISGTEDLAFLHRKLGGWTWVELNSPTEEYKRYMEYGPDVGYDFFTRAQTVHPLITGDARILRVAHRSVLQAGIDHSRLIHALQNHDEIAYQLINLRTQDQVQYGDQTISGTELADRILNQMQTNVAGEAAPYNALYRPSNNGVATTYAGFIGPALGINPYEATPEQVDTIKRAHVMLAVVSAMQPGVFALSQWDLRGALPLDRSLVQDRIAEGDMRWLNRGAVDLMGVADTTVTAFGLPEAKTLYAPLPEQLEDPKSFASQVAKIVSARKQYGISDARAVAAPGLDDRSVFALLMQLPSEVGGVAVTAANYGRDSATVSVDLAEATQGSAGVSGTPRDILSGQERGSLSGTRLTFELEGLTGTTIVLSEGPSGESEGSSGSGAAGSGAAGSGGSGAMAGAGGGGAGGGGAGGAGG
jgi:trehalose synthase